MNARAKFTTQNAARYLGTLCKHFGHKVPSSFKGDTGWIEFPFGRCELTADASQLDLAVSASSQKDLEKTQEVITNHLERFAFRENPNLLWLSPAAWGNNDQDKTFDTQPERKTSCL